ncbi:MAG: hypothetical protein LAO76_07360 [Acidobacteriia bacterium]|nr:hypothetical protein [Terriglobia bacterium]
MAFRLLLSFLALTRLAFADSFDKPLTKKVVHLGPSGANPAVKLQPKTRRKVTCYYYPGFMVKEVDLGEKGAERLAIVPAGKTAVPCVRARSRTEKVVNPDEWSGYFKGVKGSLVFFDADDGWNGGMGFAVYDAKTMKKIFEDVALGELKFSDASGPNVSIAYTRVVDGGCNLPKEQAACWSSIQKKFSLEAAATPGCKEGYEKSAQEMAKARCTGNPKADPQCVDKEIPLARQQANDASSVISYPVSVVLGTNPTVRPVGGNVRCWPPD